MKREEQLALKKVEYEGKVYPTKSYGDILVLEYINYRDVTVKFLNTGNVRKTATSEIRKGEIRDNEAFPVYAVGIMDVPDELRRGEPKPKEYSIWNNIRQRCYNENIRGTNQTYQGVEMSENFKIYSYFKDWCKDQIGFNEDGWQLDKDILSKGAKIYSEDTCCFVPPEINSLILKADRIRGKYPIGVYHDTSKIHKRFSARVSKNGKHKRFGSYLTPEEAFAVYKRQKEKYIKEVANKWKDKIDPRVYEALMNWAIEITD